MVLFLGGVARIPLIIYQSHRSCGKAPTSHHINQPFFQYSFPSHLRSQHLCKLGRLTRNNTGSVHLSGQKPEFFGDLEVIPLLNYLLRFLMWVVWRIFFFISSVGKVVSYFDSFVFFTKPYGLHSSIWNNCCMVVGKMALVAKLNNNIWVFPKMGVPPNHQF